MHKKTYQPVKDGELIAWAKNIKEECVKNAQGWGRTRVRVRPRSLFVSRNVRQALLLSCPEEQTACRANPVHRSSFIILFVLYRVKKTVFTPDN
jgi:hypothetical protein